MQSKTNILKEHPILFSPSLPLDLRIVLGFKRARSLSAIITMVIGENNDQLPQIMHFSKVCNKGFSRGGALGGHMRSHGIEDINAKNNEEGNKRTYFLQTPNNQFTDYGACNEGSGNNLLLWEPVEHTGSFKSIKEKYDTSGTSKEEKEMANYLEGT